MGVQATVVFADLFGSTGVFEALGNARATDAVTRITAWVARKFDQHGGHVVKFLGDGVLATFDSSSQALTAVVDLQRSYQSMLSHTPPKAYMPLRVGVARGDVEVVDDDCYGDAVNIAARLSELTGPHQIWANGATIRDGLPSSDMQIRQLGPIHIRGRSEPCVVCQIEWQEDLSSDLLTIAAPSDARFDNESGDALGGQIELTWQDCCRTYKSFEMPIYIGRTRQVEFMVNDSRVSRTHARVDWRNGSVVLVDVSSYGSWVRFSGGGSDLLLRREECVLHGQGVLSLGTNFSDPSAPLVSFSVM